MTHWFHRNPLKATAPVSFNYYGMITGPPASKICNDLRSARTRLLELFTDLSCFINSVGDSTQESKLRYIQNFKWTDTLQGQVPSAQQDAVFELISMGFNVALWYTKYASRLAGKEKHITEDEAKEVHRSLKIAAGIFKHLKESHIPKLLTPAEKGRDLEARLIDAYVIQCQAEAQEVTIARAIELKHAPGLIAALAYETASFYQKAGFGGNEDRFDSYNEIEMKEDKNCLDSVSYHTLSSLEPAHSAKWRKYLHLKMCFYTAYAYCYHGQTLLASDKCGEAIRSLQEAEKLYAEAEALCKEYGETKGPGPTAKPSGHLFFRKLGSLVKSTLDKCREKTASSNYGIKPKPEEEVKPVKEPDIKPQKDTGCSVS
ncbi:BRO1 domain-containing protein BROX [Apodemus speciosus]|uniref:BRO1 domain-containing protein BROX n=1 Tax=Apodemus speciosus TaxID=105296 RepID=A0ABQ0EGC2_APOSI